MTKRISPRLYLQDELRVPGPAVDRPHRATIPLCLFTPSSSVSCR
jgi:hypothetical protein